METQINKEAFDKEISLCQKLAKKNKGGCNWGKCQDCGVIPLLYKLHKGELLEDKKEIKEIRNKILKFKQ